MHYSMHLHLAVATLLAAKLPTDNPNADAASLPEVVAPALQRLLALVEAFRTGPLSPALTHQFELQLQEQLRDLGRDITEWTYNHLEAADVATLPKHVSFELAFYTRLNKPTPQDAWTLFGPIRLWRVGYRPTDKTGEPTLFPLALRLGLRAGASPALAERAARLLAESGMSQNQTLQRLRSDHGVGWGVKKLRSVTQAVSAAMTEQRQEVQVEKVLQLLAQAAASTGNHKPVLSVGRDGVTLALLYKGCCVREVATTGTLSILDRRGRRLGTVYLAYVPESKQGTMSQALTDLLQEVLRRWQGLLPRLCYVSDSGDNETSYYDAVLATMVHPVTLRKLEWLRVADYYHASERLFTMADLLFGTGGQAQRWARQMQKWLLQPGGVNRVLHSAAAYKKIYGLHGKKEKEFATAYHYLSVRIQYMRYAEYRRLGVPLGSGVTEAGCKTIYTQRLKLSGMHWRKEGATTVLNLRVLLLSGVWEQAYQRVLQAVTEPKVPGQSDSPTETADSTP
jgi:hypothetical protein